MRAIRHRRETNIWISRPAASQIRNHRIKAFGSITHATNVSDKTKKKVVFLFCFFSSLAPSPAWAASSFSLPIFHVTLSALCCVVSSLYFYLSLFLAMCMAKHEKESEIAKKTTRSATKIPSLSLELATMFDPRSSLSSLLAKRLSLVQRYQLRYAKQSKVKQTTRRRRIKIKENQTDSFESLKPFLDSPGFL